MSAGLLELTRPAWPAQADRSESDAGGGPASFLGGYELVRRVGRDVSGDVYLGRDGDGELVTVRTLDANQAADPDAVLRFCYQAKLAMSLDDPGLLGVRELGQDGGRHFLVTEYLGAENLLSHVRRKGPLPEAEALRIVGSIAELLETLHAARIVHRGIDPSSLFLTRDGRVVAANLRYGVLLDDPLDVAPWGRGGETLPYLSPQQIEDPRHADPRSDVYSLAATFYRLVTGKAPFARGDAADLLERKLRHQYWSPETFAPDLSRGTIEGIRQGLMANPDRRPATPRELVHAIRGSGLVVGGYELLEQIGSGSTGAVYRARTGDGRVVAVKLLHASLASNERAVMRFYRGAKATMPVAHENLVPILEVGYDRGRHFIAMEYVDGDNLVWHVRRSGRLEERQALKIIAQVTRGLRELHRSRIVHRDIKPSNILLGPRRKAMLADPGYAKTVYEDIGLTVEGQGLGTPQYMAPEQVHGAAKVGRQADVYALGATLYTLVTGRRPFPGKGLMETLLAKASNDYVPAEEIVPGLSPKTARLIRLAMQSDPKRRPAGTGAFLRMAFDCLMSLPEAQPVAAAVPPPVPAAEWNESRVASQPTLRQQVAEFLGRLRRGGDAVGRMLGGRATQLPPPLPTM